MNVFQCVQADSQREGIEQRWDGGQDAPSFDCIYLKTILLKLMDGYILGLIRTIFLINPANIDLAV